MDYKQKREQKKIYKQKCKENKKYIKNKTINKDIPLEQPLKDNECIKTIDAWKIVANEDKRYDLVKGVNCTIYKNEFLMVFGESGSGKTTLLSILSALDRPSEGIVNILGINTPRLKNSKLTELRQKYVGYIFQQYGLLKEVSVLENILITTSKSDQKRIFALNRKLLKVEKKIYKEFKSVLNDTICSSISNNTSKWITNEIDLGYYELNLPKIDFCSGDNKYIFKNEYTKLLNDEIDYYIDFYREYLFKDEYIYQILKKLDIHKYINSNVNNLSGGQQQRVSIARAISKKPVILFADEPTGAVDALTAKCIMQLFLDLKKEFNTTIVMVTHNNNLVKLSDRYLILENGKIIKDMVNKNKLNIDQINFE